MCPKTTQMSLLQSIDSKYHWLLFQHSFYWQQDQNHLPWNTQLRACLAFKKCSEAHSPHTYLKQEAGWHVSPFRWGSTFNCSIDCGWKSLHNYSRQRALRRAKNGDKGPTLQNWTFEKRSPAGEKELHKDPVRIWRFILRIPARYGSLTQKLLGASVFLCLAMQVMVHGPQ